MFFDVSDRQIRTYIGTLKQKGFVSVSIKNRNERVIRAVGKYARVKDDGLRQLEQDKRALIHKMNPNRWRG